MPELQSGTQGDAAEKQVLAWRVPRAPSALRAPPGLARNSGALERPPMVVAVGLVARDEAAALALAPAPVRQLVAMVAAAGRP